MGYGDSYGQDEGARNTPDIPEATYRARGAIGSAQLGHTNDGAPQLAAAFIISEGEHAGKSVPWYGYFTDKTKKRTLESLRIAGWSNDDIGDIEGFGDTEVDIVVEHNEWDGKVTARVAWVNRAGSGGVALRNPMSDAERKAFAAKLKGDAVMSRKTAGVPAQQKPAPKAKPSPNAAPTSEFPAAADDDIPF
jgi:hypothetical protein